MMVVIMQHVLLVTFNVKNVRKNPIIVNSVPVTEKKLQIVVVLLVLMILILLIVHLVLLNVPLVKTKLKNVSSVLKEELTHLLVFVKTDNTLTEKSVLIVPYNVLPVLPSKLVPNVLIKLELKPQFVIVNKDSMKTILLNVQNVMKNVKSVT